MSLICPDCFETRPCPCDKVAAEIRALNKGKTKRLHDADLCKMYVREDKYKELCAALRSVLSEEGMRDQFLSFVQGALVIELLTELEKE